MTEITEETIASRDGDISRRALLRQGSQVGAMVGTGLLVSACGGSSPSSTAPHGTPRRGGVLNIGLSDPTGGKLHDPQNQIAGLDLPLAQMMYDAPMVRTSDGGSAYALATEITSNADATEWTFRLRHGVEFQNGKTLGADDLMFTVSRALSKTHPTTAGATAWSWADPHDMQKLDDLTVRFKLETPYALVPMQMALGFAQILPSDFNENKPVGTGPWKLVSANPGQGAVTERFANYWGGAPYLDRVEITQFSDSSSEFNALLDGQIGYVDTVDFTQLGTIKNNSRFVIQTNRTLGGSTRQINMITTMAPFTDVRVRQAMRLLANRPQMIDQIFPGEATVGNDVWASRLSSDYDQSLPQRQQDVEQARSLLKQAGYADYEFQLATASAAAGMTGAAQAYAAEATAAGVNVSVSIKDPTTYFASNYITYPFWVSDCGGSQPYLGLVATFLAPGGAAPEIKWHDPEWNALYARAIKTVDDAQRLTIEHEMQKIEWERGGSILWGWESWLCAFSSGFAGYPTQTKYGSSWFDFTKVYKI